MDIKELGRRLSPFARRVSTSRVGCVPPDTFEYPTSCVGTRVILSSCINKIELPWQRTLGEYKLPRRANQRNWISRKLHSTSCRVLCNKIIPSRRLWIASSGENWQFYWMNLKKKTQTITRRNQRLCLECLLLHRSVLPDCIQWRRRAGPLNYSNASLPTRQCSFSHPDILLILMTENQNGAHLTRFHKFLPLFTNLLMRKVLIIEAACVAMATQW